MNTQNATRGIAAVETAIVLPLLLLLVIAVGEVGRAFIQYSRLAHRVQTAARFVAENAYQGTTGIPVLTEAVATQARNLVAYGSTSVSGLPSVPGLLPGAVVVTVDSSGIVSVSVDYEYQFVASNLLPSFGLLTFRPKVVMRAI